MPEFSHKDRPLGVETPLGTDKLVLTAMSGEEAFSGLFSFSLSLLADVDDSIIKPNDIVGQQIDFYVQHPDLSLIHI